ncbi:MAG: MtnX-like HAD-IB family phosphatase [candidate division Zixibacteria bacterium]|nr:MtnX-like HAD-IB family phosphatase [candidate division Zixibacteria bacterium]
MTVKQPIVFCDFDGTFTARDVGHGLYRRFSGGGNTELVERWKAGEVSSRECLREEAAMMAVTEDEVYRFLDGFPLRKGAEEFYRTTARRGIPFYIVSDGADLYIDYILKKNGLQGITYYANHAFVRDGHFVIEFPYDNDGCARCGCCKGSRMREIIGSDRSAYTVVFIGDGLSDICALPEADIVFARGDLLGFCRANGTTAIEYKSFFDILRYLNTSGIFTG